MKVLFQLVPPAPRMDDWHPALPAHHSSGLSPSRVALLLWKKKGRGFPAWAVGLEPPGSTSFWNFYHQSSALPTDVLCSSSGALLSFLLRSIHKTAEGMGSLVAPFLFGSVWN